MAREPEFFREVVADIVAATNKRMLSVNDVRQFLHVRTEAAKKYLDGKKRISVYEFAKKLM